MIETAALLLALLFLVWLFVATLAAAMHAHEGGA